jgi:hypothetical protein
MTVEIIGDKHDGHSQTAGLCTRKTIRTFLSTGT